MEFVREITELALQLYAHTDLGKVLTDFGGFRGDPGTPAGYAYVLMHTIVWDDLDGQTSKVDKDEDS